MKKMNAKSLQESFFQNKNRFYDYIFNIKNSMPVDLYSVINTTLISNPYVSGFPRQFFINETHRKSQNHFISFTINTFKFYSYNIYSYFSYFIAFLIYEIVFIKKESTPKLLIDIFFLVDNINMENKFSDRYLSNLYPVLEGNKIDYVFLPRLYRVTKNPFKLIQFFKIINQDNRSFLFEFELLTTKDFFVMFQMILFYPFKTLRLLKHKESDHNTIFNNELLRDISKQQFDAFTRYIYGKNIAKIKSINHVYSWSEFQVIERSFNYGVRHTNKNIILHGCQFLINFETYFNTCVDDIDEIQKTAFHEVLVNGPYYIKKREYVQYKIGVSLRYSQLFEFNNNMSGPNIVILGSYFQHDTRYMLQCVQQLDDVLFKGHPALPLQKIKDLFTNKITVVNDNIYDLFENTRIIVGTASGTCVEAVACGISVLVIASQDNLTANPLVEYGQGKIWDIAYDKEEVDLKINELINYREKNQEEIIAISSWYKDNFFVEPTRENIVKVFQLDNEL